jgi:hypothetical protein
VVGRAAARSCGCVRTSLTAAVWYGRAVSNRALKPRGHKSGVDAGGGAKVRLSLVLVAPDRLGHPIEGLGTEPRGWRIGDNLWRGSGDGDAGRFTAPRTGPTRMDHTAPMSGFLTVAV